MRAETARTPDRPVRFGVMFSFITAPGDCEGHAAAFQDLSRLLPLAESLGFDAFHVGEHHFQRDGWCSMPLTVLSAAAGFTTRMRLVSDTLLLPLADPLRIAEEVATLDCISGGRVTLGVAPGYVSEEFEAFGVPREERFARFEEGLDVLISLWTNEESEHRGRHYRHPKLTLSPRPVQQPPPIWYGVSGEKLLRRAARRGFPVVASPRSTVAEILRHQEIYDTAAREFGKTCTERPVIRDVVVARTTREAEELAAPGVERAFDLYVRKSVSQERELRDDSGRLVQADQEVTFASLRSRSIIGDSGEVREQLRKMIEDLRATEVICRMHLPGMSTASVCRSMEMFAADVMPALKPSPSSTMVRQKQAHVDD